MSTKSNVRPLLMFGVPVLLVLALIVADVFYFKSVVGAPEAYPETQAEAAAQAPAPAALPAAAPQPQADCGYDPDKPAVLDYQALIADTDPVLGNPNAGVTIIEYFDPNCPHCKTLHSDMEATLMTYGDRIRLVYKPVALWAYSTVQGAALLAAVDDDRFPEMLDRQFARQQRGGLSIEELKQIAAEIGLDPASLERRVGSGVYDGLIQQNMEQAREIGLTGVPALLVNGRFVAGSSRTADCLRVLIEQSLKGPVR